MRKVLIFFIRFYRNVISCHLKSQCRFYPTCSEYAILALEKYGFFKGIVKIVARLLRCHPFSCGGVDFP
ncbi:MAG: membrane protein insertion efficiency factor YidD [Holosporaceae bacterium]|nr:membrane protein insertion efficiency factor YidD [Holosporaceae bacterium]